MSKPSVTFLGLGIMGGGMAHRLLANDFPLTVYNRDREKSKPFASAGAHIAGTPREAASGAQIVISMVANDDASRGVWLGENGALAGAARDSLLIESSTLSSKWIHELAAQAAARGCRFLDAPVTGTKPHAAAGELLFMVGGNTDAVAAAKPVFSVMGRETIHLGPTGSGTLMKLVNNFVCGVQAASISEALSRLNSRMPALSAASISAPVFPTPEKTTFFAARQFARSTRSSSPPETTSNPQPSLSSNRSMLRLELAFTE